MKSIKKVAIIAVTALTLTGTGAAFADNSSQVSADGFLELTVQEVPVAAQSQQVKPKSVSQNQSDRKQRAKQVKRTKKVSRPKTYRVRKGDTLYKISRKTGVSVSRLAKLNRLYGSKKNHIEVGQRLRIR